MDVTEVDPNELLADIRRLLGVLDGHRDLGVRALVVLIEELDELMTAGNAGPAEWSIGRAMAEARQRGK
jgi:hypothetical protein